MIAIGKTDIIEAAVDSIENMWNITMLGVLHGEQKAATIPIDELKFLVCRIRSGCDGFTVGQVT